MAKRFLQSGWTIQRIGLAVVATALLLPVSACRESPSVDAVTPTVGAPAPSAPKPKKEVIVFPERLRVADESVNRFVSHAMETCASGDYDAFRLIWSATQEPMPRREYDEGWQAVQEIRVLTLEKVKLAAEDAGSSEPTTVYALYVNVKLDPEHPAAQQEPERNVIAMIVREHDNWMLARAPRAMRHWIKKRLSSRIGG